MTEAGDYPFSEVCAAAEQLIQQEEMVDVYQKFTCAGCGQRLTIEEPNKFYRSGTCDKCSTVTNIEERGCNYMVHWYPKETYK